MNDKMIELWMMNGARNIIATVGGLFGFDQREIHHLAIRISRHHESEFALEGNIGFSDEIMAGYRNVFKSFGPIVFFANNECAVAIIAARAFFQHQTFFKNLAGTLQIIFVVQSQEGR